MMMKIAAYGFSVFALPAIAFHCALALGMPWAELSWGGQTIDRAISLPMYTVAQVWGRMARR